DNYIDDACVTPGEKAGFGMLFERVLQGQGGFPAGRRAEQVRDLVGLIEASYPRGEYPEVYLSLQAIHRAQMESVSRQGPTTDSSAEKTLRVTIAKGGSSVLADAYLIRGCLSPEQADFMFGYGVLLQLMDDIQDLSDDLAKAHNTILTERSAAGPLDDIASRLWCFASKHLLSQPGPAGACPERVKRLIRENCRRILFHAVALNPDFYSERFVAMLESCCPFNFSFLRALAKSLVDERMRILSTLMRTHQISSIFGLMD
ncbi:MAG: hypothetical protein ACREIC_12150, partial [Limisphaerales bacterium]